jgi:hypothetical protein
MLDVPSGWVDHHDEKTLEAAVRGYLALARYARVLVPVEAERLETIAACWFYRRACVLRLRDADEALRGALEAEMEGDRDRAARYFRDAASHRRVAVEWSGRGASWAEALEVVDRSPYVVELMRQTFTFGVAR